MWPSAYVLGLDLRNKQFHWERAGEPDTKGSKGPHNDDDTGLPRTGRSFWLQA
jgi:hypothetical protein